MKIGDDIYFRYLGIQNIEVTKGEILAIHSNSYWVYFDGRHTTIKDDDISSEKIYNKWQQIHTIEREIEKAQVNMKKLMYEVRNYK